MSLSDDEKWIEAGRLRDQERREIERRRVGAKGEGGDFGAYYDLAHGKADGVAEHSVADERFIRSYARQLGRLLADEGLAGPRSLIDFGCGPGLLTHELRASVGMGDVLGVDISVSAIAFAKANFPACRFETVAVDDDTRLPPADVVHAREFYPFTRTADAEFHRKYLSVLASHVKPGGVMVLSLLATPKSLAADAETLSAFMETLSMSPMRRVPVAHALLEGRLPLPLARAATAAASALTGRGRVYFYVSRRR